MRKYFLRRTVQHNYSQAYSDKGFVERKVAAIVPLFLVATFLVTCVNKNAVGPQDWKSLTIGDTVEIAYQNTIVNSVHNISLSFDSVVGDSRCPTGVTCIWEGDAELIFTFTESSNKAELILHTHATFTHDTTAFGYNIKLIDVKPYPHIDSTYSSSDYSALVLVTK